MIVMIVSGIVMLVSLFVFLGRSASENIPLADGGGSWTRAISFMGALFGGMTFILSSFCFALLMAFEFGRIF